MSLNNDTLNQDPRNLQRIRLQDEDDQRGDGGQVDGVVVHLVQRRLRGQLVAYAAAAEAERVLAAGGGAPDDAHVRDVRLRLPGVQRVDGAVHDVERLDVQLPARGERGPLALRPAAAPLQRLDGGVRGRVVGQRQVGGNHGEAARVGAGAPGAACRVDTQNGARSLRLPLAVAFAQVSSTAEEEAAAASAAWEHATVRRREKTSLAAIA